MFTQLKTSVCFVLFFSFFGCSPEKPITETKATVKISTETEPHTFDPRHVRGLSERTYMNSLYEGLTRSEAEGKIVPGMAETYAILPDKKTYVFKIRKSEWSDGQPVTAYDFYETWKTMLDPEFPSPNAYQFNVIKGAKEAKQGTISYAEVGIKALDERTLVIELEKPTPYFLELISTPFFYPVCLAAREKKDSHVAEWASNGPFKLEKKGNFTTEWTMVPNPYYWDRDAVKVDEVKILKLDNSTALQLFAQKELDWAGSPLSTIPIDALAYLKQQGNLNVQTANGVYFLRLNTDSPPFNNTKFRRALAYALNRSDLVEHVLQGEEIAAQRYTPAKANVRPLYQDNDLKQAKQLFKEALQEQNLTNKELPKITVCYANNPRAHKIAQVLQQQWKEAFGLQVELQSCEAKVYFDHLKNQNYQIGIGNWFADIHDPISFLEVFKHKDNGTNNTQWEHADYIQLINQSSEAKDKQRELLLENAEELLMAEMPIIPLFYASYKYLQNTDLKGIYFSELGYLDLKYVYFENTTAKIND